MRYSTRREALPRHLQKTRGGAHPTSKTTAYICDGIIHSILHSERVQLSNFHSMRLLGVVSCCVRTAHARPWTAVQEAPVY